jgi:hypothetical protein
VFSRCARRARSLSDPSDEEFIIPQEICRWKLRIVLARTILRQRD